MTTVVHVLPGLVNDDSRPTGAIPVRTIVDHDKNDYDVRIDVTDHIDIIALARAIYTNPAAMTEWAIMMRNPSGSRAILGAAELRRMPEIRAALTIALTPAEAGLAADSLAERLEQAALEPSRCAYFTGDCNRFTVGDEEFCGEHLTDVQEHGNGDGGSYSPWDS